MKNNYKCLFSLNKENKVLRKLGVTIFIFCISVFANAQVSLYSFAQSSGTYTPLSSSATIVEAATANSTGNNLNSEVHNVTFPFSFKFNNISYTSMNVSTNGFATFGTTVPSTTATTSISSTSAYDGVIAAFGRDLSSFYDISGLTGAIKTEIIGTSPNREFVVEWSNFRPNSSTSLTDVYAMSFQIRLHETTNKIQFVYGGGSHLVGNTSSTSTAQVGLRGTTNTDFNNRLSASGTAFNNSSAGTTNSSTQAYSTLSTNTTGMPPAGLIYSWTPPTCYPPTSVSFSNITSNSANVSWSASVTPPANGYEVYYSNTNVAPTNTTTPSFTNISATSQLLPGLQSATRYYVWVRTACSTSDKSNWTSTGSFATLCIAPNILTVTGQTICTNGTATLTATADASATINWYDTATGGTVLGTGSSYTTPTLTATTNYYVSAANGLSESVGIINPSALSNSGTTGAGTTFYMEATISNAAVFVQSVDVYPASAGNQSFIRIYQGSSTTFLHEIPFTSNIASGGVTPQTIPISILLSPGTYRFKIEGAGDYYRNYSSPGGVGQNFPYGTGNFKLTGGSNATTGYYLFYNFKVGDYCESPRQQVTATVDAAGCLSTSEVDVKENFKVYPNPFTDFVNISNVEKVKSVRVMDVSGRIVKTIEKVSENINLSELKSGMYLLNLELKDGSKVSYKIIKK